MGNDKPEGDEEFEDVEWDEEAADEVLFNDDDEEEDSIDDVKLTADDDSSESSTPPAEEVATEKEEASEEEDLEEEEEDEEDEPIEAPPAALEKENIQPVSLKDVPVAMSIEVGRLQVSAQQLMDMQTGNVLDLRVQAQAGVDLVVNNQLVGRGELVQVGDSLGIRVLEVGK